MSPPARRFALLFISLMLVGGLGCQRPEAPPTAPAPAEPAPSPAKREVPPGVKPHYVPCDPAHPELPCTPDPPPLELPPPVSGNAIGALGAGRPVEAIRGCTTDADCVVSCRQDGDCCPELCTCEGTYNKVFFAELEAHQRPCTMEGCAKAKCAAPSHDMLPTCVAGLCAARRVERKP